MSSRKGIPAELQELIDGAVAGRENSNPAELNREPRPGDIFLVWQEPHDGNPYQRHVFILGVDNTHEYANVLLVGARPEYVTDCDLTLEPSETGLPYRVVVYCDLQSPVWTIQLTERDTGRWAYLGSVSEQILDLIPSVSKGAAPGPAGRKVGMPINGTDDPRRAWKLEELMELHRLASGCTGAILAGKGFFDGYYTRKDEEEGNPLLQKELERGETRIWTRPRVFTGEKIFRTTDDGQEREGILDPGVFTTENSLDDSEIQDLFLFLAENPRIRIPYLDSVDGITAVETSIRENCPEERQLLMKALGGINTHSRFSLLERISVDVDEAELSSEEAAISPRRYMQCAAA